MIVANEQAGSASRSLLDEVEDLCGELAGTVRHTRTAHAGHAREIAAEAGAEGVDVVVAVGGDGTSSEAAGGLLDSRRSLSRRPALLIVPAGTGNSFYREVWQDRPWQEAMRSALDVAEPHIRLVDMARIEETGETVLLGACSGLAAEALETAAAVNGCSGRDRYQEATAITLRTFAPHPSRITVDGEVIHEGSVVLANVGGGRYRAGRFLLLPRSVLDDGLLDVCVLTGRFENAQLMRLVQDGGRTGQIDSDTEWPGAVYGRGRRVEIERLDGKPLTFERDGELVRSGHPRYSLRVLPGALPLLSPLAVT
ncbi:diacylglycerol kinase family lipid kinase [Streptomyces daliensis]